MMSSETVNVIRVDYEETISEDIFGLIGIFLNNSHSKTIILLISTTEELASFRLRVASPPDILVWHIDRGSSLYDRDLALICLLVGIYDLDCVTFYNVNEDRSYRLRDYLQSFAATKTSFGFMNDEIVNIKKNKANTEVARHLLALKKSAEHIEDRVFVYNLESICDKYLNLLKVENKFYLRDNDLVYADFLKLDGADYFLKFPYYDIKVKYDQLLEASYDPEAAKIINRRVEFFKILVLAQNQFKTEVRSHIFPMLLKVLAAYLCIIAVGNKNNNDPNLGCLTLFRALELFIIGILIAYKKGSFNGDWEFRMKGGSLPPTFGTMWDACAKCIPQMKQDTLNSITRIQFFRNHILFTHGLFTYNTAIYDFFHSSVIQFATEYEQLYIPEANRMWEQFYSENNVSITGDIHKHLVHSTLKRLDYDL